MSSIYFNAKTDRHYRAATGLDKGEFKALSVVFSELYNSDKNVTINNPKAGVLTDKKEALFFVLHHLKTGCTYENLGLYFNMSQGSAHSHINLLKPILKASLSRLELLPFSGKVTHKWLYEKLSDVEELFIDVSEIRIERPENEEIQKDNFSGKKKTIR